MKKIVAIALLLCVMLSLCACPGGTGVGGGSTCEHNYVDSICTKCGAEKYEPIDSIPDTYNFNGDSLSISCRSDYVYELYAEDGSTENVDPLIYRRNRLVQDRFNMKVQPVVTTVAGSDQQTHFDEVADALQNGRFKFDVISMWIYQSGKLILANRYLDWRMKYVSSGEYVIPYAGESLDTGAEWWPSLLNDPATVFGCQYIAVSDMCLTSYENAYSIAYNYDKVKDMKLAENAGYKDMYDIVRKGDWTLDLFKSFGSGYYADNLSGGQKDVKDETDTYGILYAPATGVDAFIHAFGEMVIKNDGQNMPELWNVNLSMVTKINELRDCLWGSGVYAVNSTSNPIEKMFAEGHGLFATLTLEALRTPTMHSMEDDYGVLPYPKYNTNQKQYFTGSNDHYNVLSIPLAINPARYTLVGVGIEALSAETSQSIETKFYEKLLKAQSTRFGDDEEMLDLIIRSRVYDLVAGHHGDLIIDQSQAAARHLHAMWRILIQDHSLEVADYWALGSTVLNGDETVQGSLANLINRYLTM